MTVYSSVLEMIGNTPIVDVSRAEPEPGRAHPRQDGGPEPRRLGQGPHRPVDDHRGRGRRHPHPGLHDHRAVLGQHRHRHGDDLPDQGLPDQDRAARERLDRASPAARGLRGRDHRLAGRRGLQRRGAPGASSWPTSTPTGCSSTSTATRPTPGRTTSTTGPEIWRDVPEITHFVAGLGTSRHAAWASGTYLKEQNPDIKVLAVEPPSGEQVEGLRILDDGYIPPVFDKWGGYDLLDGKSIVRPRESLEYTRAAGRASASSRASPPARPWPARCKVAERIESGTIVFVVCDDGWKYLSTGAWTDRPRRGRRPTPRRSSTSEAPGSLGSGRRGVASVGGRAAHRDVRLRVRRPHRGPGADRPAARRGPRLPRRHRPLPLRAAAARRGGGLRPPDHRGAGRTPRREAGGGRLQHGGRGGAGRAPRPFDVPVVGVIEPGVRALGAGDPQRATSG